MSREGGWLLDTYKATLHFFYLDSIIFLQRGLHFQQNDSNEHGCSFFYSQTSCFSKTLLFGWEVINLHWRPQSGGTLDMFGPLWHWLWQLQALLTTVSHTNLCHQHRHSPSLSQISWFQIKHHYQLCNGSIILWTLSTMLRKSILHKILQDYDTKVLINAFYFSF